VKRDLAIHRFHCPASSADKVEGAIDLVIPSYIDRTVIELLHLSRRFDGEYDVWETLVVTQ